MTRAVAASRRWSSAAARTRRRSRRRRRRRSRSASRRRTSRAGRRDEGGRHARHAQRRRDRRAVPAPLGRHHALLRRGRRGKQQYLGGKIEVKLRVGDDGRAEVGVRGRRRRSATTTPSAACSASRASCTSRKPHGGGEAEFTYPIEFHARAAGADVGRGARGAVGGAPSQADVRECKAQGAERLPPSLSMTVYVAPGGKMASAGLAADAPLDDAFAHVPGGQDARLWRLDDPLGKIAKATVGVGRVTMIDFELTDEQQLVRDTARDFADARAGAARRRRAIARARFPSRSCARSAELGLLGVNMPEALGGAQAGVVAYSLAMTGDRARRRVGVGGDGGHQHGRRGDRQVRHRRAEARAGCRG